MINPAETENALSVINHWLNAINNGDLQKLLSLYHKDAWIFPVYHTMANTPQDIELYYTELLARAPQVKLQSLDLNIVKESRTFSGKYQYQFGERNQKTIHFTMTLKDSAIVHEHASTELLDGSLIKGDVAHSDGSARWGIGHMQDNHNPDNRFIGRYTLAYYDPTGREGAFRHYSKDPLGLSITPPKVDVVAE